MTMAVHAGLALPAIAARPTMTRIWRMHDPPMTHGADGLVLRVGQVVAISSCRPRRITGLGTRSAERRLCVSAGQAQHHARAVDQRIQPRDLLRVARTVTHEAAMLNAYRPARRGSKAVGQRSGS